MDSQSDKLNPSAKAKFGGQRGAELNSQTTFMWIYPQISVCCLKHTPSKSLCLQMFEPNVKEFI